MASTDPAVVVDVRMMGISDVSGTFTLVAPLPPTLNQSYHSYPVGGHCRMVLSKVAREWKEVVTLHVRSFWNASGHQPPKRAVYGIRATQFLTRNARDADSSIKLVMDSIFDGMGVNDNKVYEIALSKVVAKGEIPRIVVMVRWHV